MSDLHLTHILHTPVYNALTIDQKEFPWEILITKAFVCPYSTGYEIGGKKWNVRDFNPIK